MFARIDARWAQLFANRVGVGLPPSLRHIVQTRAASSVHHDSIGKNEYPLVHPMHAIHPRHLHETILELIHINPPLSDSGNLVQQPCTILHLL